jgi:protocatechuate 3,4-dioxygenase, alpha subunit
MGLGLTPSQTIGPFFDFALPWQGGERLVAEGARDAIRIEGAVVDGDSAPITDALVEIWQADPEGRYPGHDAESFRGFGRCPTDEAGGFWFKTVKPGSVPGPGGTAQAPHLAVSVFARGLLRRLITRMYFPAEEANERDPVLALVEDTGRRETLIARRLGDGIFGFDIRLQGAKETVFFDLE